MKIDGKEYKTIWFENKIVKIKDPIKVITPDIFATFKSKPKPASHTKCLISFKIWKLKVQQSEIIKNFPKKVFRTISKDRQKFSPKNNEIAQKQITINAKKFITPTTLCVIDNKDDICHL